MVVFEDGLARKSEYRMFNIRGPEGQGARDDTAAMHEVITRRFRRYLADRADARDVELDTGDEEDDHLVRSGPIDEVTGKPVRFAYPPNLVVVDGGPPQVAAAAAAMAELGIDDVALCGLAKRLEEVWLPGEEYPVILQRSSEGLYLLQRLRDEAHRFAITAHRKRRSKGMTTSVLDDIPGLGPARQAALLRHFGSVKRLRAASVEEIASVQGMGDRTAAAVVAALNPARRRTGHHRVRRVGPGERVGWHAGRMSDEPSPITVPDRNSRARGRDRGAAPRPAAGPDHHRHVRSGSVAGRGRAGGPRLVRHRQPPGPDAHAPRRDAHERGRRGSRAAAGRGDRRPRARVLPGPRARCSRACASRASTTGSCSSTRPTRSWSAGSSRSAGRTRCRAPGRILDGIAAERAALVDLRERADTLIDTSELNVHDLAREVRTVVTTAGEDVLQVSVLSFGFKYGVPLDADHVVDVRFLANPYWITELRHLTGRDAPVRDYVLGLPGAVTFVDRYVAALEPVLAGYLNEEKRYVTIAVGCTGGKHRSVAISEAIAARLRDQGHHVAVSARDLGKE